jgi:hypothetical protein
MLVYQRVHLKRTQIKLLIDQMTNQLVPPSRCFFFQYIYSYMVMGQGPLVPDWYSNLAG